MKSQRQFSFINVILTAMFLTAILATTGQRALNRAAFKFVHAELFPNQ